MQLNHNSFSAKLYRWFYGVGSMPSNLCPYFWRLIFSYIMVLPLFLVTWPYEILHYRSRGSRDSISNRFFISVVSYIFLCLVFAIISGPSVFFGYRPTPNTLMHYFVHLGVMLWILATVFGFYYVIWYLIDKIKNVGKKLYDEDGGRYYGFDEYGNKIYYVPQKPNIVVEFAKAKYNKYCPKIDWNNEPNETDND